MDIMKIVNQAKDIIINPKGTMQKLKFETVTTKDIIIYLAIVGLPTFLGIFLGYGFVGWGFYSGWVGYAFALGVIMYILSIIGIIIFGYILNALAKNLKSKENKMQSLKLVSYAATPWLLLGIVSIYPPIAFISLLGGIYGLYILYMGIPILMETSKEQHLNYFIIGLVIYIIVVGIIYWLAGFIWGHLFWGSYWGHYGYYWHP